MFETITKRLSLILILAAVLALCGCQGGSTEDYSVPDLDGGAMRMLCIGNVDGLDSVSIRTYSSRVEGGFSVSDGQIGVERPTVHQYFIAYNEDLGSPITLPWTASSYKDSFMLSADFYAFEGKLSELKYEYTYFDTESLFDCTVRIYNDSELVGKLFFNAYVFISRDWIENFVGELENALVCVDISRATSGTNSVCLALGNIGESELCSRIVEYSSSISGGWHTDFWKSSRDDVVFSAQMSFIGADELGAENLISLNAEFYEIDMVSGTVRTDSDTPGQIKILCGDHLLGLVNYTSEQTIDADMLAHLVLDRAVKIYINK